MRKTLLFLVLVLLTCTLMSQINKRITLKTIVDKTDSIQKQNALLNTKINTYSKILDDVISENKKIIDSNKNLELKVAKLEAEKGYYKSGLQGYTAIFACIVTLVVVIMGYFNSRKINDEIDHFRKTSEAELKSFSRKILLRIKEQETSVNDKFRKINKIEADLLESSGGLNTTIGLTLLKEDAFSYSILYFFKAAKDKVDYLLIKNKPEEIQEIGESFYFNLTDVKKTLDKLSETENLQAKLDFLGDFYDLNKVINNIKTEGLPRTNLLISEIRIKLNELKEKFEEDEDVISSRNN